MWFRMLWGVLLSLGVFMVLIRGLPLQVKLFKFLLNQCCLGGGTRSWQGGLAGLVVTSIPVSMKLMSLSGLTRLVSQDHDAAWAVEEMRRRATSIALVYLALGTFLGAALGGVGGGVEGLIRHYIGT